MGFVGSAHLLGEWLEVPMPRRHELPSRISSVHVTHADTEAAIAAIVKILHGPSQTEQGAANLDVFITTKMWAANDRVGETRFLCKKSEGR